MTNRCTQVAQTCRALERLDDESARTLADWMSARPPEPPPKPKPTAEKIRRGALPPPIQ